MNKLRLTDYIFALFLLGSGLYAYTQYGILMDGYELAILAGSTLSMIGLGWFWKSLRWFIPLCCVVSLFAIYSYHGQLTHAHTIFILKYGLASQSAVLWMCVLFFLATLCYWIGLLARSEMAMSIASGLTWAAAAFALISKLVRWHESYLIGADIGHIPVSNLYEVFILFCLITALMYLYYEATFHTRQAGAFVLLVITAAVGFILWYTFDKQAHEIQPLIPALQSWWMKIHVPANFIGYGAFAISAMLGLAQICISHNLLKDRLPSYQVLSEMMYKAIAIGFLFFTIATVLGALWAADAWGGYWSWDPKEVWALIVWLNYAAWLHMRLIKGWRGDVLAWWAVVGLLVTTFAFIGVNIFLSGLHSYGEL
jgi:cytochrome c-type biogenesis protein CcsB